MQIVDVMKMARALMDAHGLTSWNLRFDRARRRAGMTVFSERTISLSRPLMVLYSESEVRGVILHEIAHALVGPGHNHDAEWKRTAVAIGASSHATLSGTPQPKAPWVGRCPNGHEIERYRRPSQVVSCSKCSKTFNPAFAITWHRREN